MVKILSVQPTPNPEALKFIASARLTEEALEFDDRRQAAGDPLAQAIFDVGPVAAVFILDRFVTVTKVAAAEWDTIIDNIVRAIETNARPAQPSANGQASPKDDERMAKIRKIIDEAVLPALANDGGGLEILGFQNNVLTVQYQGACGGCPNATAGTLRAIQNLLQSEVDPQITVDSI